MIGPNATIDVGVTVPVLAQLGQVPTASNLNEAFPNPIHVRNSRDVMVVGPVGARLAMLTAVYGQGEQRDQVYVYTGCFGGTLEMFEDAVVIRKKEGDPHRAQYEYVIEFLRRLMVYRGVPAPVHVGAEFYDDYGG